MNRTLLLVALLLLPSPLLALEARVAVTNGAPQILIDNTPVRPRMFWGHPGSRLLSAGPTPQVISFEFSPEHSATTATLHLRFGEVPGNVYIDNVQTVDIESSQPVFPTSDFESPDSFAKTWTFWPPANTVATLATAPAAGQDNSAALHIALKAPPGPAGQKWPDFHIYTKPTGRLQEGRRYRTSFWIRSDAPRDLRVCFYRPGQNFLALGGPEDIFAPQIKLAAASGANFISFPLSLPWPEPGKPADFSVPEQQCQRVLKACPTAWLLPRVSMNAPKWWLEAHPGEAMTWEDGSKGRGMAVPGSVYTADACARLAAVIQHLEQKLGHRIIGYHPSGQNTGEWFYEDTWKKPLNGYSPADRREFRAWLQNRYKTDDALRAAWSNPAVTLATAEVPTAKDRHAAPTGIFRDASQQPLVDFARFQQELMADCVLAQARTIRQNAPKKLSVFFYGYSYEFAAITNGPAVSGHYALRRALLCPDIDILCAPISYFDRGLAGSGPTMTCAESVALAGKMWLQEDDTATYLSRGSAPGYRERVLTLEDTNRQLVRNTAQCAIRNLATWWMDLGATGWFNDPGMWAEMKRLEALDNPLLATPTPYRPQVAAVIDERSMLHVAAGGTTATRPGVYESRRALGRMGAPYGQYLLDDVAAGKVSAKLYVFLNAWCLTPAQRNSLQAATKDALRVWCYAPGYLDDGRPSLDAMRQLTGFRLVQKDGNRVEIGWTEGGKRHGLGMVPGGFGTPSKTSLTPLFAAADATPEETLATWPDGSAAIALRGKDLFVGIPALTPELLRLAARRAGVHLYTETDANVYATGPYLVIHAADTGNLTLHTPHPSPIKDLLTGQILGTGPKLQLQVKSGDTRVLQY